MATLNISSVLDAAAKAGKQAGITADILAANTAAEESLQRDQAARYRTVGVQAAIEATEISLQTQRIEDANNRMGLALAADPEDTIGRQAKQAEQLLAAQDARAKALANVTAKQSINLFTDPLGWLQAQFTINDDIAEHNTANSTAADIEAQIAETNAALTKSAQNFAIQRRTVTDASIAANAERLRQLSNIQADEAARQALLTNSKGATQLLELTAQQLQFRQASLNPEALKNQQEIALAHLAMSRQEFAWKTAEKEKGDAAGKYVSDTILAGQKILWPDAPQKWDAPNSPKLLALISGRVPLDGDLKAAFDAGEINKRIDPELRIRQLATSPVELLQVLRLQPSLSAGQRQVVDLVTRTADEIKLGDAKYRALVQNKDLEGATKYLNDAIREAIKLDGRDATNPNSLYNLPSVAQLATLMPGIKSLATYEKVLAPMIAAGVDLSTPDKVFSAQVQAIAEGKLSLNEAATDAAAIYRNAQGANLRTRQLVGMGLPVKEEYRVPMPIGLISNKIIDAANSSEYSRALSIALSQRVQRAMLPPTNPLMGR